LRRRVDAAGFAREPDVFDTILPPRSRLRASLALPPTRIPIDHFTVDGSGKIARTVVYLRPGPIEELASATEPTSSTP